MNKFFSAGLVIVIIVLLCIWDLITPPEYSTIQTKKHPTASLSILSTALPTISPPPENFDFISELDKKEQRLMRPYILYQNIISHLPQTTPVTIDSFLKTYQDSPLSLTLRKQWLLYLAKTQQWQAVIYYYQPVKDRDLSCILATAYWQTNHLDQAKIMAQSLWQVPYPQPKSCDGLFDDWLETVTNPNQMIEGRFWLALQNNQVNLAQYLAEHLTGTVAIQAKEWLNLYLDPTSLAIKPLSDNLKEPTLLSLILYHYALDSPYQALNIWQNLSTQLNFTPSEKQPIFQGLALGFYRQQAPQTLAWMSQILPPFIDNTLGEKRLRFAISRQDWANFIGWLVDLSPSEQNQPIWRYWQARALEQLGQGGAATHRLYEHLRQENNYYGLMAAFQLKEEWPIISPLTDLPTPAEKQALGTYPPIQRALLLFKYRQNELATREWWYTIRRLPPAYQATASLLAYQHGLDYMGLKTAAYLATPPLDWYYPQPYRHLIHSLSQQSGIDPALVYAIIRQESQFNPEVQSYAGAIGLMQLMPSTANMLIKQDKLPEQWSEQLRLPPVNIKLGSLYLSRLGLQLEKNPGLVAAAYNAGPSRVKGWLPLSGKIDLDIWIESIPITQTRDYVKAVLTNLYIYQVLQRQKPMKTIAS